MAVVDSWNEKLSQSLLTSTITVSFPNRSCWEDIAKEKLAKQSVHSWLEIVALLSILSTTSARSSSYLVA
jgi:hypothetical protein